MRPQDAMVFDPRGIRQIAMQAWLFSSLLAGINAIGENSDSIIITAYNDRNDIRKMIHTISVTRDSGGNYSLHNAYKRINGRYAAYNGNSPVSSLWEMIGLISQGQAAPICELGIRKPDERKQVCFDKMDKSPFSFSALSHYCHTISQMIQLWKLKLKK